MSSRSRVGIIHYTAPPALGGIENLIASQLEALCHAGLPNTLISGTPSEVTSVAPHCLPLLNPANPRIIEGRALLNGGWPDPDHPLCVEIFDGLLPHVKSWDYCWVHNAFTVWLNPFLTCALYRLVRCSPDQQWVAWCSDISDISQHTAVYGPSEPAFSPTKNFRYVTLSQSRRDELARFLMVNPANVTVISPPIHGSRWLGIGAEASLLIQQLQLERADVIAFVPAKLLPHKGLNRVVRVAASLQERAHCPRILISGAPSPHEPEVSQAVQKDLEREAVRAGVGAIVRMLAPMRGGTLASATMRSMMMLADVIFIPSLEEGFGIPLLEAGILRAPILCTDLPVFREVAGSSATFFTDSEPDSLVAERMTRLAYGAPNVLRRKAIASWTRFCKDLFDLL
ncbi:MAG: hypothetical protein NVSMB52_12110 [Chloroflexota bacterium]